MGWFCLPSLLQWNCIILLLHYEHRKPSTVSASPAVIRIASKHLHNDLARAIEALEQKKLAVVMLVLFFISIHARLNRQHTSCWNSHRAVLDSATEYNAQQCPYRPHKSKILGENQRTKLWYGASTPLIGHPKALRHLYALQTHWSGLQLQSNLIGHSTTFKVNNYDPKAAF